MKLYWVKEIGNHGFELDLRTWKIGFVIIYGGIEIQLLCFSYYYFN